MSADVSPAQKTRHFLMWAIIVHNVQSTLDINPIFSAGTRTEQLNITKKLNFLGLVNVKKKGSEFFFQIRQLLPTYSIMGYRMMQVTRIQRLN